MVEFLSNPHTRKITFDYLRRLNEHDGKMISKKVNIFNAKLDDKEEIYLGLWTHHQDMMMLLTIFQAILVIHDRDRTQLAEVIRSLKEGSNIKSKKLDRRINHLLSLNREISEDDKEILEYLKKLFPPK